MFARYRSKQTNSGSNVEQLASASEPGLDINGVLTSVRADRIAAWLGFWAAVTLLVAIAGPFGTYESADFPSRLVYWGVVNAGILALALTIKHAYYTTGFGLGPVSRECVFAMLITILFAPFLAAWTRFFFPAIAANHPNMGKLALQIMAICLVFSFLRFIVPRTHQLTTGDDAQTQDQIILPRLVQRLPDGVPHEILRLSVDGHKVQVFTTGSEYELRMRFGDAVNEMDGVEGYCAHRSHWVAGKAIAGSERRNGKIELLLVNGDRVPVSRKYRPDLEAAGII